MTNLNSIKCWFNISSFRKEKLDKAWKIRGYPDPKHPLQFIPFRSRSDMINFLIRMILKMPESRWRKFSRYNSPDLIE